jgi:predicted SprT family Zn-dependent metalloprotease
MAIVSYETKPTTEYEAYQFAFDHFNRTLFECKLPYCLITFQRIANGKAYFWGSTFTARHGEQLTDEIAMNPEAMDRPDLEILSTLAHEMCHLWQHHFGKPSRSGYHNKEWAARMLAIGLIPSDTGKPGGKQTGQNMTHYIAPGGQFVRIAKRLIASGFALKWQSHAQGAKGATSAAKARSKTKYTCPQCEQNAWAKPEAHLWCGECIQQMQPE